MLHASVPLGHLPAWEEVHQALLVAAAASLDTGLTPAPTLVAYEGDEPLATILLRPFGPGELIDVLIEALALLLPVGSDRIALSVPGRAWSTDDPIPPVTAEADLRTPVVVVTTADAHDHPCQVSATLHPYAHTDDDWAWQDVVDLDHGLEAPATDALRVLLESRTDLASDPTRPDPRVAAQFARILLLGHDVLLAPLTAARLEVATQR